MRGNSHQEGSEVLANNGNSTASGSPSDADSHKDRDHNVVDATTGLNHVILVAAWTVIIALILVFINEFTDKAIPSWGIIASLLFGHFILFLVIIRIMRLILRSLLPKNDVERATQKWHQANEKRIPLIQYTVYNVSWIFGVSFLLVLTEILALLNDQGLAPVYAALIPLYLLSGAALCNSVVCRSTSLIAAFTWTLILAQLVMYNIKVEEVYNDTDLPWILVLVPALALVSVWVTAFAFIWAQFIRGAFHLHQYQMESLTLYLVAGSAFLVSLVALQAALQGVAVFTSSSSSDEKISAGSALAGACAFFAGLSITIDHVLREALSRMGGERPQALVRSRDGGWYVDEYRTHQNWVLTGDVESSKISSGEREKGCGCCGSLELVTRSGLGVDEQYSEDEETPLTRGSQGSRGT